MSDGKSDTGKPSTWPGDSEEPISVRVGESTMLMAEAEKKDDATLLASVGSVLRVPLRCPSCEWEGLSSRDMRPGSPCPSCSPKLEAAPGNGKPEPGSLGGPVTKPPFPPMRGPRTRATYTPEADRSQ
jgi:hypothetical protein